MRAQDDPDTLPTLDDGLLDHLRSEGLLGPFTAGDGAGRTHRGLVRERNEDALALTPNVFVVADGVGGQPAGHVAAQTAVRSFAGSETPTDEVAAVDLLHRTNEAVLEAAGSTGAPRIGTTLVALISLATHLLVVSIGDSRCYRFRDGVLDRLTTDHNVRSTLAAAGVSVERAVDAGLHLNQLTSHLGMPVEELPSVFTATYSIQAGDRYLLCTDGIHSAVPVNAIAASLRAPSCDEAAANLVAAALDSGGRDNATAVVVEMVSVDS